MSEKKQAVTSRLSPELKSRLEAAAKQDRSSVSRFVLLAIEAACAKAEERANNNQEDKKK